MANLDVTSSAPATLAAKPVRRLPVQKDWPTWAIVATQVGVLVGILAFWEFAATTGLISAFFWSQPSAIYKTLIIFVTEGDAWTDIGFTFRSTIFGFALGTTIGSLFGLSFWWSRNYAAIVQPYIICFEFNSQACAGAAHHPGVRPRVELQGGDRLRAHLRHLDAHHLCRREGARSRRREAVLFAGATRWQVFRKLVVPFCLPWVISVLRVNIGLALTGAIVGEFIASQHGLGRQILYAGQTYDIALVWVAVLVLSTLAVVMYATVSWLENVLRKGTRQ